MQSLVVDLAQIPTKYVLLTCHRHSCLYHDLSQLQIRVLLCPPTLSLSPLVTSYPFPAPDKTVGLSFKLSFSHLVTSWPDPAPKKCAALLPEVVTVKVGYIIASSSSIPICWSVPLSCQCHCWLHNSDLFFPLIQSYSCLTGPFNYIFLAESLPQLQYNPLWLTGLKAPTN